MLNKIDAREIRQFTSEWSRADDFVSIRDVAGLKRGDPSTGVYLASDNLGTGAETLVREFCDSILDLKTSDLGVAYTLHPPEVVRHLVPSCVGSLVKAGNGSGFCLAGDLRTGLLESIRWRDRASGGR